MVNPVEVKERAFFIWLIGDIHILFIFSPAFLSVERIKAELTLTLPSYKCIGHVKKAVHFLKRCFLVVVKYVSSSFSINIIESHVAPASLAQSKRTYKHRGRKLALFAVAFMI